MTNNAQLLPMPELSDDDLELLHYNPNTSDVVEFLHRYAQSYALACIEAAKPADALGSLPVVAYVTAVEGVYLPKLVFSEKKRDGYVPLTDHAQATAEIAKRDTKLEQLSQYIDSYKEAVRESDDIYMKEINALRAKLAGVDGLVEAFKEVLRISDRKHDAWDTAKAALEEYEAEHD